MPHASESGVALLAVDMGLLNDGTVAELQDVVRRLV
jgi:hypothetical protein